MSLVNVKQPSVNIIRIYKEHYYCPRGKVFVIRKAMQELVAKATMNGTLISVPANTAIVIVDNGFVVDVAYKKGEYLWDKKEKSDLLKKRLKAGEIKETDLTGSCSLYYCNQGDIRNKIESDFFYKTAKIETSGSFSYFVDNVVFCVETVFKLHPTVKNTEYAGLDFMQDKGDEFFPAMEKCVEKMISKYQDLESVKEKNSDLLLLMKKEIGNRWISEMGIGISDIKVGLKGTLPNARSTSELQSPNILVDKSKQNPSKGGEIKITSKEDMKKMNLKDKTEAMKRNEEIKKMEAEIEEKKNAVLSNPINVGKPKPIVIKDDPIPMPTEEVAPIPIPDDEEYNTKDTSTIKDYEETKESESADKLNKIIPELMVLKQDDLSEEATREHVKVNESDKTNENDDGELQENYSDEIIELNNNSLYIGGTNMKTDKSGFLKLERVEEWECPKCKISLNCRFCPECGSVHPPKKAWFCPECGSKNETKFCPECGGKKPEEKLPEWTFCPDCGKPFKEG